MKKLRILLADDHKVVREGLRLLMAGQRDLRVVGEAANGKEAVKCACKLKPDVVVMDLSMPELNGLQATERIRESCPEVKVVALTVHEDPSYLIQLCKAGASGYVLKRSAGDDLIQAIRAVAAGGVYYDPAVASKALSFRAGEPPSRNGLRRGQLSERERQVLILVAWGCSNKEVAAELQLSVKTVETYRRRLSEKLGFQSRTEVVQYALRQGWLNEPAPSVRLSR
jgi:two-component system, NarL family, response regulator NreC